MSEKNDNRNFDARIGDLCERACRHYTPAYTAFLTPEEHLAAEKLASGYPDLFVLAFGGFMHAERAVLGFFPSDIYLAPEKHDRTDARFAEYEAESGIAYLKIIGSGFVNFDHRDVLGSVMATGLKREAVGDIYVSDDAKYAYLAVFVRQSYRYRPRQGACEADNGGRAARKNRALCRSVADACVAAVRRAAFGSVESVAGTGEKVGFFGTRQSQSRRMHVGRSRV